MKRLVLVCMLGCGGSHHHAKPPPPETDDEVAVVETGDEGDDDRPLEVVPGAHRTLLDEATRILTAMRTSTYVHKTAVDEEAGRFDFDCSGFVDYALAHAQPRALEVLRAATVKRPLAKHFVAFFQALPAGGPWQPIARAIELAPGDVVAWLKPDDVTTKNTGHVMIVRDAPHVDPRHADVVVVPIIDSTGVPHGASDSRKQINATGLGTGEVLLVVDERGAPIGYRWSRGKRAHVHRTTIALAGLRF